MTDEEIIKLFFDRSESAIERVREQYGSLCASVAGRILPDKRDVEECVGDTWLNAWNAIPPERPNSLKAYLARITRNLALDRYTYNTAEKRSTALTDAYEELEEFVGSRSDEIEQYEDRQELSQVLNDFLRAQSRTSRVIFVRRYFYGESMREIAPALNISEAKVKSSLFRTRTRMRETLLEANITI